MGGRGNPAECRRGLRSHGSATRKRVPDCGGYPATAVGGSEVPGAGGGLLGGKCKLVGQLACRTGVK